LLRRIGRRAVVGAIAVSAVSAVTAQAPASATPSVEIDIVEPPFKLPLAWGYEPRMLTVTVGARLTWSNTGTVVHTVTADDDGKTFDSGNMPAKPTFSFLATVPGTIAYHCRWHPWMKGTIVVRP
jgi:plastocyanin